MIVLTRIFLRKSDLLSWKGWQCKDKLLMAGLIKFGLCCAQRDSNQASVSLGNVFRKSLFFIALDLAKSVSELQALSSDGRFLEQETTGSLS